MSPSEIGAPRNVLTSRKLMAALPVGPYLHQYVYFDLEAGRGQLLLDRPGPELKDGDRLWDALQAQFAGELKPAVRVSMADWPLIEYQWQNCFTNRPEEAARPAADMVSGAIGESDHGGAAQCNARRGCSPFPDFPAPHAAERLKSLQAGAAGSCAARIM